MNGVILICTALAAAGLTFATNWLALIPWRRSKDKHWSEQARLAHPVIVTARSSMFSVPVAVGLATSLLWPEDSYLWFFTGLASIIGCYLAIVPLDRELFPRIPLREIFRLLGIGCFMTLLGRILFIVAAVSMPPQLDASAFAIGGAVLVLWMLWAHGGMTALGLRIGFFAPAPERLRSIVASTAAKMNVAYREVILIRLPTAQAYAMPSTRQLLFTERLLEILADDEIAAVCAHELGHLTESRKHVLWRSFLALWIWMPWLFFNPLIHVGGIGAFFLLLANTYATPVIQRHLSHRLEVRADGIATTNQGDEGTYAHALLKIYQDNYAPAVNAKKTATHPHLYDRMLAAGITPDFPRPLPSERMSWNGRLFAVTMGILLGIFAIRFAQSL